MCYRVEYGSATAAKMSIDRRTAVNLELISNARRYYLMLEIYIYIYIISY